MTCNKRKEKKVLLFIMLLICISLFLFSTIHIIKWVKDSKKSKDLIKQINDNVTIEEIKDDNFTNIIKPANEDEFNPYFDYIKMNLIDVDLTKLKKINNETVGWIKVNGTEVNYPFLQTNNNTYYLTHSFNKSYNEAGWVFLDYRNSIENIDKNNIIYAHGRLDQIMFGSLKNILKNDWFADKNNHFIKISTEFKNSLWQIFSVYKIPTTSDYLQINFKSPDEFLTFATTLKKRSQFPFDTQISKEDKIITLSTCYNDQEKMVIHAKLIKYS